MERQAGGNERYYISEVGFVNCFTNCFHFSPHSTWETEQMKITINLSILILLLQSEMITYLYINQLP